VWDRTNARAESHPRWRTCRSQITKRSRTQFSGICTGQPALCRPLARTYGRQVTWHLSPGFCDPAHKLPPGFPRCTSPSRNTQHTLATGGRIARL